MIWRIVAVDSKDRDDWPAHVLPGVYPDEHAARQALIAYFRQRAEARDDVRGLLLDDAASAIEAISYLRRVEANDGWTYHLTYEGDPTATTWIAAKQRTKLHDPQPVKHSGTFTSADSARLWLLSHLSERADASDWPPTRSQYRSAAAAISRGEEPTLFGSIYRIVQLDEQPAEK